MALVASLCRPPSGTTDESGARGYNMRKGLGLWLGIAALSLAGCSDDSTATDADGAGDADADIDIDVTADTDAGADADSSAEADAGADADDDGDALPDETSDAGDAADVPAPVPCDPDLALADGDPLDAARAIGLCDGVISAAWVLPDGTPATPSAAFDLGHGILSGFGPNVAPREGDRLLALSSGTARSPADPGYGASFDKGYACAAPSGYPMELPACPGVATAEPRDGIGLDVEVEVPPWATGFAFDSSFYTHDFPDFVCGAYNDLFLALVTPTPLGLPDANVAFDAAGNPLNVDSSFLDACTCPSGPPCVAGGLSFDCALGMATLAGTGFGADTPAQEGGATDWLETRVPAAGGTTIRIRFTIYDSGDGVLDSTVLLDGFRWLTAAGVEVSTARP
ncbi:MAG: hypothetical protein HY905_25935 [Deltaproteobacteria bacterium]|nr:hypothetical protein [Deltaproteobacteria bacterium]